MSRYLLHLKNLSPRDFGDYSCVAENPLGTVRSVIYCWSFYLLFRLTERVAHDRKHIEGHGRPNAVEFESAGTISGRNFHQLSWSVTSYTPVQEYRLLYSRINKV